MTKIGLPGISVPFLICAWVGMPSQTLKTQEARLAKDTALRIAVDRRVRNHVGASVIGHLTEPVYSIDHLVIPAGTAVQGTVTGEQPAPKRVRITRLLAGDFTPPNIPTLVFQSLALPDSHGGTQLLQIEAPATQTDASVLTLGTKRTKRSLKTQVKDALESGKDAIRSSRQDAKDTFKHPRIAERIEKWAINQLPYHPEMIWTGTRFNAELADSVSFATEWHTPLPIEPSDGHLPSGVLHARLVAPLTSDTAKRGDPVEARVTQPLLSTDGQRVIVPEGTALHGVVVQTRGARSFGRNGMLRFAFRSLDLKSAQGVSATEIHGRLSAAETDPGQHVTIDEEGQTRASDGPAKITEPLLLGILATAATPDEHDQAEGGVGAGTTTVASNGFGLIARVTSLATMNTGVLQGFAYYSLGKSLYFHWVAKGHETTFPKDTDLQVTLSER